MINTGSAGRQTRLCGPRERGCVWMCLCSRRTTPHAAFSSLHHTLRHTYNSSAEQAVGRTSTRQHRLGSLRGNQYIAPCRPPTCSFPASSLRLPPTTRTIRLGPSRRRRLRPRTPRRTEAALLRYPLSSTLATHAHSPTSRRPTQTSQNTQTTSPSRA